MKDIDKILEAEAFKDLGENRINALKNFLRIENPSVEEVFAFMGEINKGGSLSPYQQKALFSAFLEGLSPADRKRAGNILEIMKAFL